MTTAANIAPDGTSDDMVDANEEKFLSFKLGNEEYGVEILRVREIIGVIDITPLPQTPEFIKGVINLRGKIIPVMELRTRFGLESVAYDEQTCIIVVEVGTENADPFHMGVIVDTVNEVMDISNEQIEPAPQFGCQLDTEYIMGMGKSRERVLTLLAIERILSQEEVASLANCNSNDAGDNAAA